MSCTENAFAVWQEVVEVVEIQWQPLWPVVWHFRIIVSRSPSLLSGESWFSFGYMPWDRMCLWTSPLSLGILQFVEKGYYWFNIASVVQVLLQVSVMLRTSGEELLLSPQLSDLIPAFFPPTKGFLDVLRCSRCCRTCHTYRYITVLFVSLKKGYLTECIKVCLSHSWFWIVWIMLNSSEHFCFAQGRTARADCCAPCRFSYANQGAC